MEENKEWMNWEGKSQQETRAEESEIYASDTARMLIPILRKFCHVSKMRHFLATNSCGLEVEVLDIKETVGGAFL